MYRHNSVNWSYSAKKDQRAEALKVLAIAKSQEVIKINLKKTVK
jgi:hypothetical protein